MLVYTDLAERLVRDIVRRVPDLAHIDPERLAVVATARCSGARTGNLASCCSLRDRVRPTFSIWTQGRSRRIVAVSQWYQSRLPVVRIGGRRMLYLIQVRLPRMLLAHPLETLVHELYHIGEAFDGGMRPVRHGAFFDREVRRLTAAWLERAKGSLPEMARMNFNQLVREHGAVLGLSLPSRFKIPYLEAVEPPESYRAGVERLYPGLTLAPGWRIRLLELEPDPLTQITEKNLELRHFERGSTRRVSEIFVPYARRRAEPSP